MDNPRDRCSCHERMGNDFYFLPRGSCLHRDDPNSGGCLERGRVLLVGEQPPQRWSTDERYRKGHSAMFPYPPRSAGSRLHEISGLSLGEYIHGLQRVNLIPEWTERWSPSDAIDRAKAIVRTHEPRVLFACGARVSAALGYDGYIPYETESAMHGCRVVFIPHPSGRNHAYNAAHVRDWVRAAFQRVRPLLADWTVYREHERRLEQKMRRRTEAAK